MFGDDLGRVALLISQVDEYCRRVAELLAPGVMLCLAGAAGFLAWAPGKVKVGRLDEVRPWDLAALALNLLGLAAPPSGDI